MSESADIGSVVTRVEARAKSSVHYEIESGNVEGVFRVSPTSGVIFLSQRLDFEDVPSYKLVVRATNAVRVTRCCDDV